MNRYWATAIALLFGMAGFAIAQNGTVVTNFNLRSPLLLPFTNGAEGSSGQFNLSSQVLLEGFDTSTLNIINNWRTPTTGGGGNAVAATNATSDTVLSTGTIANGWSLLQSIKVITEDNPGYLFMQTNVNIAPTLGTVTNACYFIGFGTVPANPVCGAMATNAAGFETTASGALNAVTYASGTRLLIADLSTAQASQPVVTQTGSSVTKQILAISLGCSCTPQAAFVGDTGSHKLGIHMRGDNIVFETEGSFGQLQPVAETLAGSVGLDINAVPVTFVVVAGPTGPNPAATLQINQVTVGRTSGRPESLAPVVSPSAENSRVFKSSAGQFLGAYATNLTSTAGFLAILNSATAPGDGAILPLDCVSLPASGSAAISVPAWSWKHYNTGITAVLTSATTCFTKTTGTITGFISGSVQ